MTISGTYLQLQKQIADEIGDRTDLLTPLVDSGLVLSPIQNAVQTAIAKWEREPFYFNAVYAENGFSTVSGQEFYDSSDYAAIATLALTDKLHVLISSNRYTLNPRTWNYLEDISVNPAVTGQPIDYAYFAKQLRFYPIPNGAYPITHTSYQRVATLSADSDANIWTQDGYDLIRSEAKLVLAREVIHDADLAGEMELALYGNPGMPMARGYVAALRAETARRQGAGRVRPTYF